MTVWYTAVTVLLLLANGFFVGAEFALVAARRTKVEALAKAGDARARTALRSIRELSFMLAGAQLGITMCSLGLGFVAEPAVANLIETGLGTTGQLPDEVIHSISIVIALGIVTFLHMVIGEMAPKNIAIAEPEKTALWIAVPFRVYVTMFRPIVDLLNKLANLGTRLLGQKPQDEMTASHTAEEIGAMIEHSAREGMIREFEHRLLSGAIGFRERDAASAMVPRTEMVAIPVATTAADLERTVVETGHSRFPVYGRNLDNVYGFFHAKDLLKVPPEKRDQPLPNELIRQMLIVPESRKLHPLLIDMRRQQKHLALVIDEHGGTSGIVTLENLVEELVGEIRDEYDIGELGVEKLADNRYLVPGTLRIDEAADHLQVDLPEGEYETVAGFLMSQLGRIPRRRDTVEHDGWRLRVRSMHRRRVVQVLIEPAPATRAPGPNRAS
jgi:CBS domain containing-hemolysin-like protein